MNDKTKIVDINLSRAIKERDDFLRKNPELYEFQEELEKQFQVYGNTPYTNMQVIRHHLMWNLHRLNTLIK